MNGQVVRPAAVAGHFYPADPRDLRELVRTYLAAVKAPAVPARAVVVPHAGLVYSGRCAAQVFGRLEYPPTIVILGPNHTGVARAPGGASLWKRGAFDTPFGPVEVAETFAAALEARCPLVADDPAAHRQEHAVEVELPFLATLAPDSSIVPIVLAWDDWERSRTLAEALADTVADWPDDVLLVASSDMTHFESAVRAAAKDRIALEALARLDGEELLRACRKEQISMCGRAPAAVVVEAARRLGAKRAEVVDYRHSGWVTGDDSRVVAYAGVVVQ
ncbi:MAG: AmmeMemoRadiSam system protein B [Gemmatimonadales bacterium]|jgi:AmmeMemoRadiSam system protein B